MREQAGPMPSLGLLLPSRSNWVWCRKPFWARS